MRQHSSPASRLDGVSLPAVLELPETEGRLDESFLESLRVGPGLVPRALLGRALRRLPRVPAPRSGDDVRLGERHASSSLRGS